MSSLLECEFHKGREFHLVCFFILLYPSCLEQCLADSRLSVNKGKRNEGRQAGRRTSGVGSNW